MSGSNLEANKHTHTYRERNTNNQQTSLLRIAKAFLLRYAGQHDMPELAAANLTVDKFGKLVTNEVDIAPRGQMSALVTKLTATAWVAEGENKLYRAGVQFSYNHRSGSNGYGERFVLITNGWGTLEYVSHVFELDYINAQRQVQTNK